MKYLVIDASPGNTGIRDKYDEGYLSPEQLGLSSPILELLKNWLTRYETEFFNGYMHESIITRLDREGKEIALKIKNELKDVKVEYFSDAKSTLEMI